MIGNKILKRGITTIVVLAFIIFLLYTMWNNGCFLPQWITWESKSLYDGSNQYEIVLKNKKVSIEYKSIEIWESPSNVKVQDILLLDIDNDNIEEILLLCWKRGRYGKHKPFWVKEDEQSWSQHIFVYELLDDNIKPQWMSSYLGLDVNEISSEISTKKFLVLTDLERKTSYWVWDSWGFTRVS